MLASFASRELFACVRATLCKSSQNKNLVKHKFKAGGSNPRIMAWFRLEAPLESSKLRGLGPFFRIGTPKPAACPSIGIIGCESSCLSVPTCMLRNLN